jgi:H+/Cl- antiporter ClcA
MKKIDVILNQFKMQLSKRHLEETIPFIGVGIFASLICSFYALAFALAERESLKLFHNHPLLVFVLSPLLLLLSLFLVRQFSPGASGSGIPQVLACIDKSHRHLADVFLSKTIVIVKLFSSSFAVFAGAAIGREGPSIQISAALAYQIGRLSQRFKIPVKIDQLLITGAASGLAAAFNTPIGGIVYAIEELSQDHVRHYKDVLLIAVVLSGITAQMISGNYLYLGFPNVLESVGLGQFLILSLFSLVTGILGAGFSRLLTVLARWRAQLVIQKQVLILILVGLVIGGAFYFIGERAIYSGKESINFVLFSKGELAPGEFLARFFMPILSSMTGIAGGIFAPSLSAGATFGGFVSSFCDPSIRTLLGLCGMVAFLTGVTRTPITSFILVLEMTNRHSAVFPMMLASVLSTVGAYLVSDHSFYEEAVSDIKRKDLKA